MDSPTDCLLMSGWALALHPMHWGFCFGVCWLGVLQNQRGQLLLAPRVSSSGHIAPILPQCLSSTAQRSDSLCATSGDDPVFPPTPPHQVSAPQQLLCR